MPDRNPTLDPALEEVLLDLARDPESQLLRVQPAERLAGVSDRDLAASSRSAGWTAAERELLNAHRDQVAGLLRRAMRARAYADERGRDLYSPYDNTIKFQPVATREDISSRAAMLSSEGAGIGASSTAIRVLETLCGDITESAGASLSELACLSLRLAPSHYARVYLAIDCNISERFGTARHILNHVLASAPSDLASYAWSSYGVALGKSGDFAGAITAYRQGIAARSDDANMVVSAMINALLIGDDESALWASSHLDQFGPLLEQAVSHSTRILERASYEEEGLATARKTISRIRGRLHPLALEVANVLR